MDDFEEALRNIDVFCKVLVEKMVESLKDVERDISVEPMEKLLRRKYIIEEQVEQSPSVKHFIPLPQVEEPLIDIFDDDNYVKVLMQCRCKDQKVTVQRESDGLQICVESMCRKLNLPVEQLQVENMIMKCNNNKALEVEIPKLKTTVSYDR
ncbi:MAG: hypothetical protein ACUVUF_02565 [Candidatus Bathycorpusculaceae bacterium]